jgi:amino acid transporter
VFVNVVVRRCSNKIWVLNKLLLATSTAISGTVFGASRQMAVISHDGYLPGFLARRKKRIPVYAILTMSAFAFLLVLAGNLEVILEFGSVTFLLVSMLMAYANFKLRKLTGSSAVISILSMLGLLCGAVLIIYFELINQPEQLLFIGGLYVLLTAGAWVYSRIRPSDSDKHVKGTCYE